MSDTVWDKDIDNCLAVGLIILLVGGIVLNGFAQYFQYSVRNLSFWRVGPRGGGYLGKEPDGW